MNEQEQIELIHEVFDASMPRLGPGSDESTRRALDALLPAMPRSVDSTELRILDIGCGNGAQTIQLAKHAGGTILAVDNHRPYLEELERRAEAAGVSGKIRTCLKDMRDLGPGDGPFDLIWSEGALNLMGFRDGLTACRPLLARGGLLATSELTWFKPDPPDECREFFALAYPAMTDVQANLDSVAAGGYEVLGHFVLPESDWWDRYYNPLERRLRSVRDSYAGDRKKLEMIELFQLEIDIYRRYSNWYGYVFYLMRNC